MKTCCSVPQCVTRGGHLFPKDTSLRVEWVKAIRRSRWRPSKFSVVCHKHFKVSDYMEKSFTGAPIYRRLLKPGAIPSIFSWNKEEMAEEIEKQKQERPRVYKTLEEEYENVFDIEEGEGTMQESLSVLKHGKEVEKNSTIECL